MKPIVKNKIALFQPQGFVDGNNAAGIILMGDVQYTLSLQIEAVLVSLEKVIFFNKNGLYMLAEILKQFKDKMGVVIGFCGYKERDFRLFFTMFKDNLSFSLFDTFEIATLFIGNSSIKSGANILIWTDDKSQKNAIVFELYRRGYNPVAAKSLEDFTKRKNDTKHIKELNEKGYYNSDDIEDDDKVFTYSIYMTHLGSNPEKIASHTHGNLILYSLFGYIDNNVTEKFDVLYHQKCLNVGFKLFVFDAAQVLSVNIHGVNFFSRLSTAAAEYGATICITGLEEDKIQQKLRSELEDAGIIFYSNVEALLKDTETIKQYSGGASVNKKSKQVIKKDLITKLPLFIDAAIYTMNILANAKAVKRSVELNLLNITDDKEQLLASSIGFYGDLDGIIVLVFSKEIAKKACSLLIGEDEVEADEDNIVDALGEFVNLIGGRVKIVLSEQRVNISITIPRTFENIDDLVRNVEAKKGAQVCLEFNGLPFYFFLTK